MLALGARTAAPAPAPARVPRGRRRPPRRGAETAAPRATRRELVSRIEQRCQGAMRASLAGRRGGRAQTTDRGPSGRLRARLPQGGDRLHRGRARTRGRGSRPRGSGSRRVTCRLRRGSRIRAQSPSDGAWRTVAPKVNLSGRCAQKSTQIDQPRPRTAGFRHACRARSSARRRLSQCSQYVAIIRAKSAATHGERGKAIPLGGARVLITALVSRFLVLGWFRFRGALGSCGLDSADFCPCNAWVEGFETRSRKPLATRFPGCRWTGVGRP
jgi:hypothetical protein